MAKILVADDNTDILDLTCSLLELEDHEVFLANDGEEAIAILEQENDMDIVFLDVQMPVTNGWETLSVIKDPNNGWPDVKVIMVTVQRDAESVVRSWGSGAEYFIAKPFTLKTLITTLEKALGLEEYCA